jgi:hypothetical protein
MVTHEWAATLRSVMQNVTGTQEPPGRLSTVINAAVTLQFMNRPMVTVAPSTTWV